MTDGPGPAGSLVRRVRRAAFSLFVSMCAAGLLVGSVAGLLVASCAAAGASPSGTRPDPRTAGAGGSDGAEPALDAQPRKAGPPRGDVPPGDVPPGDVVPRGGPEPSGPAGPPVDTAAVLAAVDGAAAVAGGSIAVVVLDPDGRPVLAGTGAGAATYAASLVKLLVVARLLVLSSAGDLPLGADDVGLMAAAVTESDDDAMNALWGRYDGDRLVTELAADLGLAGTAAPAEPGQWGQATTTAADVAVFLGSLGPLLGDAGRETLLGWMRSTSATAADGFRQAFGLLSAEVPGGGAAAKQGWMCCLDGRRQLHSAGVLPDGRIVVLVGSFPDRTPWAAASTALDAAARAAVAGTAAAAGPATVASTGGRSQPFPR